MSGNKRMSKRTAKAPAMDVAVGQRIRELRRARKLSLETVAARTDLSIGFLSQIERGLSSPSLRVLAVLADVLGIGIAGLFGPKEKADAAPDAIVTREKARAKLNLWRTGISKQLLSPAGSDGPLNLFLVHLEPGGSTGDELYTHDGEEAGLVLEGEMNLTVDIPVEPGRHTLQVRNGRNSSSTQTFDAAEDEVVAFRCTGKRFLPIFLASFVVPRLALKLVRD